MLWLRQLVILNFCFAMEQLMLPDDACSAPSTQQKFDLFNKATGTYVTDIIRIRTNIKGTV
ncbi:hypothetical protein ECP02994385_3387 [Escherichia coli P0299438.5]|nr:hypothetical protein EC2848050_5096 [Escherichia coli 2848050]ENC08869.1 hypothetical protein ECP02994385_3387 [Escherichia coli P0299438.5]KIZ69773.1 hypothetical protein UH35_22450 [Escherichia coli]